MANNFPKRSNGGIARSNSQSPEERTELAKKAAKIRWLKATHKGSFLNVIGVDIPCFVLNDDKHTAVITRRGIAEALNLKGGGGSGFVRFTSGKTISMYISPELQQKIANPIIFGIDSESCTRRAYGYDVTVLIDICNAIIQADLDDQLTKTQQANFLLAAKTFLSASAKLGIQGLVYKLAGFNSTREQVIEAFRQYIREEARKWSKEFPDDLYIEWQRIYKIPAPVKGRNWEHYHLTLKHIYIPLAGSNGRLLSLLKESKREARSGKPSDKLHQFLNEVGLTALRAHIWQVVGIAKTSPSITEYENRIGTAFGGQLPLLFDEIMDE